MTDEWLAGFFDGEGCVSGFSYFHPTKYIKHPRVNLQITITQKDKGVLKQIQSNYGGSIYEKSSGHHCWNIKWTGKQEMGRILRIIAPYVICKKEQVLLALKFIETLRDENLGSKGLPEEVHIKRKEIYDQLRVCKM
jgi:LAGLIDADG endonuclease.